MGDLWGDNSLDMDDDDETSYLAPCSLNSLIQHEDSMDNLDSGTGDDLWDNGTTGDVNSVVQSPTSPGHDEGINSPSEENLYQAVTPEWNTKERSQDLYDMIITGSISDAKVMLEKVDLSLRQKICEETVKNNMNIMTLSASEDMVDVLRMFADLSLDVHCLDSNGKAAIHYAVTCGHMALIDFLICNEVMAETIEENTLGNRGTSILTMPDMKTPLHLATEDGENLDVVDMLLERGADVDAKDKFGNTPLHYAAKGGSVHLPEKLLGQGASVNIQNDSGETALHLACQYGHAETAAVLTTYQADVNLAREEGWTPLHIACFHGHTVIIYQLLDVKADPFCPDSDGKMPIHFACTNNLQSAVRRMLFSRASSGSTQEVVPIRVFKVAQSLPAAGLEVFKECIGNVNPQNFFGQTALHYAAREGDLNVVSILLSCNAGVDIGDRNGNTPLHLALIHKHFETAKALILQCPQADCKNKKKESYLYLAILSGNLDLVELLLKYGADVNACSPRGEHLVSYAIQSNSLILLEKLMQYGANMELEMMHGLGPLHAAAKLGHTDICKILLLYGSCVNAKETVVGRTALHLAAESGHLATVVELLTQKADVNSTDTFHKKPLHLAAAEGHKDVVEVLLDTGTRVLLCDDSGSVEYDLARHQEIWDIIREWVYNNDPSAIPVLAAAPPPPETPLEAPPSYSALAFFSDL